MLIGGGVGVPPLVGLAKALVAAGKRPSAILGFNRAEEIFCRDEFAALGVPVTVTVYAVDPEAAARFEEYLAGSPFPSLAKRPESDLFATDYSPWSWGIDYERRSLCGIRREYCAFDEYKKYSRRDHDAIRELQERLTALRGNKIAETAEE